MDIKPIGGMDDEREISDRGVDHDEVEDHESVISSPARATSMVDDIARPPTSDDDQMPLDSSASSRAAGAEKKWEDMYSRLLAFKNKHGHCLVPNRYRDDTSLGSWVATQRRHYRVLGEGSDEPTSMTDERIEKLESIGFQWATRDPRHVPWKHRYQQLVEFKERFGHSQVPIGWEENVQLSNWVSTQRQEYKLLQKGRSSRLTQDRIDLLNNVNFVWQAQRGGPRRKRKAAVEVPAKPNPVLGVGPKSRDSGQLEALGETSVDLFSGLIRPHQQQQLGIGGTQVQLGQQLGQHLVAIGDSAVLNQFNNHPQPQPAMTLPPSMVQEQLLQQLQLQQLQQQQLVQQQQLQQLHQQQILQQQLQLNPNVVGVACPANVVVPPSFMPQHHTFQQMPHPQLHENPLQTNISLTPATMASGVMAPSLQNTDGSFLLSTAPSVALPQYPSLGSLTLEPSSPAVAVQASANDQQPGDGGASDSNDQDLTYNQQWNAGAD